MVVVANGRYCQNALHRSNLQPQHEHMCMIMCTEVSVSQKVHTIYGTFKKSQQIYMLLNKWRVENGRRCRCRCCRHRRATIRIRMMHFICLVAHIILFWSFKRLICVALDGTQQFRHCRRIWYKWKYNNTNNNLHNTNGIRNSGNERVTGHIVIVCAIVESVL